MARWSVREVRLNSQGYAFGRWGQYYGAERGSRVYRAEVLEGEAELLAATPASLFGDAGQLLKDATSSQLAEFRAPHREAAKNIIRSVDQEAKFR